MQLLLVQRNSWFIILIFIMNIQATCQNNKNNIINMIIITNIVLRYAHFGFFCQF